MGGNEEKNSNRNDQVFHSMSSACAYCKSMLGLVPTGVPISEMKVDPEKDAMAWKGFERCMENITKAIPAEKHKSTILFLGATAGMRLLQ